MLKATLAAVLNRSKSLPAELQLLWIVQAWGTGALGAPPNFLTLLRLHKLAHSQETFRLYADPNNWKKLTQAQWRVIRDVLEND